MQGALTISPDVGTAPWENNGEVGLSVLLPEPHPAPEPQVDDYVRLYMKDIARIPLLTAEQEVQLSKEIEEGERSGALLQNGIVDPLERRRLEDAVECGVAARQKMVESNLRLVVSVAARYQGRGLPISDLIEEGNIGLMRAVEKFDYRKGYHFSTYAFWWVRQAVTRSLADQSRTVRLPVHMVENLNRLGRVLQRLQQELARQPTRDEIALAMGIHPSRLTDIVRASQQPASLDAPLGEDGEGQIGDLIEDTISPSPAELATQEMLREQLASALDSLTLRERRVLELRFGMWDGRERTLAEVGHELAVTRERARQIESEALEKLRRAKTTRKLRDFLD